MSDTGSGAFINRPDPEHPGWLTWQLDQEGRYNAMFGRLIVRREGDRSARVRMLAPERRHSNLHDRVHGGVTLGLIDVAMFAAAHTVLGGDVAGAVTLDATCQFIGAGRIGQPLDVVSEVLRETGRMVFLRGLVEQDGTLVASYTGTLRKSAKR